ncbi:MAG TPA: SUMF1/EgtB/PvdO family nonheme iron enzyme, partial [Bacteroidia bacterium]|nr:SUMF1/EgtB/PvdO family nonheme iron enzyme [Bacteroidia bacterium]
ALPVLAEDTPAKLAELRQVWEAEYGKIRADLDGKLSQSLQALEADLTRARRLDEARTVLAYREGLPPSENASPATAPSRADTPTSGFVDLFSESGQKEWRQSGDGGIDFKDGVGTTRFSAGDQGAFGVAWYAKRTFRDFIYEVEFRAMQPRFNSGLRLRFPRLGREPMKATEEGYEVAITDTESDIAYPTGSIHGFQQATSSPLKRLGEWNTLSVEVVGQSYTVTLNGQVVARFTGSRRAEGYIGIENHRRGAVQFRNVRIKEIAPGQGAAAPAQPSAPDGTLAAATKGQPFANSLGMKFVPVPETKVLFCIHETRQKDYAAYAAENPGTNGFWRNLSYEGHRVTERVDDHPVGTVNWHDATDFCRWLSEKEGLTYRLPTDEEWSMAVGLGGKERRRRDDVPATLSGGVAGEYPWGSEWPPPANAGNYADESFIANAPSMGDNYLKGYDDGFPTTAPVMSFAPNRFGLYDMGGNQQEWIGDWYDAGQSRRLLRGAGWAAGRNSHLLSSFRIAADASDGRYTHGFRVVVELP